MAALALQREWQVGYDELLAVATPGFFAFGLFSLPAGWLADRWSRDGMMCVFFFGIGTAAILTGFASSPLEIGAGLFAIGMFAAIYHPVGLALVTMKWRNTGMRIAVNGVWGNLGVAAAALIAGNLIEISGWRSAFFLPGAFSILVGCAYLALRRSDIRADGAPKKAAAQTAPMPADYRRILARVSGVVFLTTAFTAIIFQSTTFALPKIFDERLGGLAGDIAGWLDDSAGGPGVQAGEIGALAFLVFAAASMAQLVVGKLLDRYGPRPVFLCVAAVQVVFFAAMPGLTDLAALAVALGFMFGAFGQIPINDFLIGKLANGPARARIYGVRYVVSFTSLAASLPLIALIYGQWGFDRLFLVLAAAAALTLSIALLLPRRLPEPPAAAPAE